MAAVKFHPPANLSDMDGIAHAAQAWDLTMRTMFREGVRRVTGVVGRGHSQFFDYLDHPPHGALQEATVTWNGFPKTLYVHHTEEQALAQAEMLAQFQDDSGRVVSFRQQDEYLEWYATHDAGGRITAVDFTCEGPEYWMALAHGYPASVQPGRSAPPAHGSLDLVLALYRQHVSPDVQLADLLVDGVYDPYNAWNTVRGAMHLTHPSNNLTAEVFLAADATVIRESHGQVLEDDDDLIRCAQYGEPTRASDPAIGGRVNALARAGALVSLRDPVGLYIDGLDDTGWTKPDGSPVGDYWTIVRGEQDAVVRARYEVPAAEGFAVGDIRIGGEPIRYAGQIAEHITMKLTGVAAELGQHAAAPVGCVGGAAPAPAPATTTANGEATMLAPASRRMVA
ncbi:MAG TPA: hypothetical protein VH418_10605 [Solirubrobacteraceae bacterium]